uniref:Uncharacterized protein n=1 Tax=Arundo donax TaxID=35708 RepID=A0A0A9DRU5_ARUDO
MDEDRLTQWLQKLRQWLHNSRGSQRRICIHAISKSVKCRTGGCFECLCPSIFLFDQLGTDI